MAKANLNRKQFWVTPVLVAMMSAISTVPSELRFALIAVGGISKPQESISNVLLSLYRPLSLKNGLTI